MGTKLNLNKRYYQVNMSNIINETVETVKTVKTVETDNYMNVINVDEYVSVAQAFKDSNADIVCVENSVISEMVMTNSALQGRLANVSFIERNMRDAIKAHPLFINVKCNYWELKFEAPVVAVEIDEPVPVIVAPVKSNRGRKRILREVRLRKKQGDGSSFNSQITFHMRSIAYASKEYKIKIFNNGSIQIPGLKRIDMVDDVVNCIAVIAQQFQNDARTVVLADLFPTMKNYKAAFCIRSDQLINLIVLKTIFQNNKSDYCAGLFVPIESKFISDRDQDHVYSIMFDAKYNREEETKITLLFSTPTVKKPKKKLMVKIFFGGKINFLGSSDDAVLSKVYNFLVATIHHYASSVIVVAGVRSDGLAIVGGSDNGDY